MGIERVNADTFALSIRVPAIEMELQLAILTHEPRELRWPTRWSMVNKGIPFSFPSDFHRSSIFGLAFSKLFESYFHPSTDNPASFYGGDN